VSHVEAGLDHLIAFILEILVVKLTKIWYFTFIGQDPARP
jgi:hypothetical protein